jgi:predicted transcriptional regulator of viral defense system
MKRPILEKKIEEKLKTTKKGKVFFAEDFTELGNVESINRVLSRLRERGKLVRLAFGIYLYPKVDKELGILYPSVEEIAAAIARRDKARIIPTGIQALNKLGLSTQVPLKAVYLTDGAARAVKVGNRTIKFKKTSPKNLAVKGEISALVIQALKSIGKNKVEDNILVRIKNVLKKERNENIIHDDKLAPTWICKILMSTIK